MTDVTPPAQRRKNAKHRANKLMSQFAHEMYALERHVELELERVDLEQLDALDEHIAGLSTSNCWYAEWDVRHIVTKAIQRKRFMLAHQEPSSD